MTKQLTIGLNVFYAPDYYRMGAWENYDSLTAKYDIGWGLSFSAELGHQFFGTTRATTTSPAIALPDYTYANAGFSYTYKSLTFDLRYHATTSVQTELFPDNRNRIADRRIERLRSCGHRDVVLEHGTVGNEIEFCRPKITSRWFC